MGGQGQSVEAQVHTREKLPGAQKPFKLVCQTRDTRCILVALCVVPVIHSVSVERGALQAILPSVADK